MKIKKIISIFTILFFIAILFSSFGIDRHTCKAKNLQSLNGFQVYWFPARVKVDDIDLKYKIISTSSIRHSSKEVFNKAIWDYLRKRIIIVGPFQSRLQATMARSLYAETKEKMKFLPDTGMPTTIYWFNVHFVQSPRLKIYVISRLPASVSAGSLQDFKNAFYFQMQQQSFPIGPFYDKDNAEEAKRIYRQNE